MKKQLLTLILAIVFNFTYAIGPLNIGLKFGTNSSTLITNVDEILQQNLEESTINNYLAGAFVRVNLKKLYVQPELYFNTKGGIIKMISSTQFQLPTPSTFNFQTIDVPVLIGFKVIDGKIFNARLHGGPVFSYVTSKSFVTEISNFNTSDLNNRYIGWQLGAGVDFWFLTLDARIENSSNIFNDNSNFTAKNRVYLLSAGIKLF